MRKYSRVSSTMYFCYLNVFVIMSLVATIGLVGIIGTGCSCERDDVLEGVFVDSTVSGLTYETLTQEGITDGEGTFKYRDGEEVTFYIGTLLLGTAVGQDTITPLDLVGVEMVQNQEVTNICRLLQSLDQDGDISEGIHISRGIADAVSNWANSNTVTFDQNPSNFNLDGLFVELNELFANNNTSLRTPVEARLHLLESMGDESDFADIESIGEAKVVYTGGGISCLAVDSSGNIYTQWREIAAHEILKITPAGEQSVFSTDAQLDTIAYDLSSLYINDNDDLFAVMKDNIVMFDADGNPSVYYGDGDELGFSMPGYLTGDEDGNLYVSNTLGGDSKVFKINTSKVGSVYVERTDLSGIGPTAFDSDGNMIYFGDELSVLGETADASETYMPSLSDAIITAYQVENTIPENAMNTQGYITEMSFAMDESGTVYGECVLEYVGEIDGGWKNYEYRYVVQVSQVGYVQFLDTIEVNDTTSYYRWKDGHLYYIKYTAADDSLQIIRH